MYSFEMNNHVSAGISRKVVCQALNLAALIPPSTAEVERSFVEFNINVFLRKRLLSENLTHYMRIWNFSKILTSSEFEKIQSHLLQAEGTKTSCHLRFISG